MNPGPSEEVGKAVGGFMGIMGREPLSLALVVMNLALLGYMFYETRTVHSGRLETVKIMLEMQKEVQQLLAKCVVPTPPRTEVPQEAPQGALPGPPELWAYSPQSYCRLGLSRPSEI